MYGMQQHPQYHASGMYTYHPSAADDRNDFANHRHGYDSDSSSPIQTLRRVVHQWLKNFIVEPRTSSHLLRLGTSTMPLRVPYQYYDHNHTGPTQEQLQILGLPPEFPFLLGNGIMQLFDWVQPTIQDYTSQINHRVVVRFRYHGFERVGDWSGLRWSVTSGDVTLGEVVLSERTYRYHREKITGVLILLAMIASVVNDGRTEFTM
ncbi:hypothetical protein D9758_013263 [Tetrapyrgos nigripes]|uniref:Uncharacterized protein n=1 Tax=Tetrapyrgos nigripes TaxID=182062 RepID=A0A8H5CMA1_9AGAR|nr:hypothetical protein D9758_018942 [Tetrapyrgos nigripes]KAF5344344.1 hypothetical protein D9758_013263 [Tetrapyrgos nigripes]